VILANRVTYKSAVSSKPQESISMMPPYGWEKYENEAETLFVGYAFRPYWPIYALSMGYLFFGYPSIAMSLCIVAFVVCVATVFSLFHGYRLNISEKGIDFSWTYCGVVYRRISLPLTSIIRTAGGFGDADEMVVLEIHDSSEDIELMLSDRSAQLSEEFKKAQNRWQKVKSATLRSL